MTNGLDKLIGNDELLTYICLILAILNIFLMSMIITDIKHNFSIYIFLLFEALLLIFIVYFLLKKKDVYSKDDDIKYDWYFYLRISIIILVFFNFALYIYNISKDPSINPKKTGGVGNSIIGSIKNMYYRLRDKEAYFTNKLKDIQDIKQQIFNNNKRLTESFKEQKTHYEVYNKYLPTYNKAIKSKRLNDTQKNHYDTLLQNLNNSNEKLTQISDKIAEFNKKNPKIILAKLLAEEKQIKEELAKIKKEKGTSSTARGESSNRIHPILEESNRTSMKPLRQEASTSKKSVFPYFNFSMRKKPVVKPTTIEEEDSNLSLQELQKLNEKLRKNITKMSSNPLPTVSERELNEL